MVPVTADQSCNLAFEGVPCDTMHARHRAENLRGYLSITARDHHKCPWMVADDLSSGLPGLHGCLSGDRASVDNTKICHGPFVCRVPTLVLQLLGNRFGFIAVYLAAQGRDGKRLHVINTVNREPFCTSIEIGNSDTCVLYKILKQKIISVAITFTLRHHPESTQRH